MAEVRMDPDQVETFAQQLKNQFTQELMSLKSKLNSGCQNLNWVGPDADQFKGQRAQEVGTQIEGLINKLQELATIALNNAAKQREASNTL